MLPKDRGTGNKYDPRETGYRYGLMDAIPDAYMPDFKEQTPDFPSLEEYANKQAEEFKQGLLDAYYERFQ